MIFDEVPAAVLCDRITWHEPNIPGNKFLHRAWIASVILVEGVDRLSHGVKSVRESLLPPLARTFTIAFTGIENDPEGGDTDERSDDEDVAAHASETCHSDVCLGRLTVPRSAARPARATVAPAETMVRAVSAAARELGGVSPSPLLS